jgi:phenylalanyl-tRNA synthetase alpha chain
MASGSGIDRLHQISERFEREKRSVSDRRSLDELRGQYLSRKSGLLTLELQSLRDLPKEERAEFGRLGNELKRTIESALSTLEASLASEERTRQIERETVDVSLPGTRPPIGHRHPVSLVRADMEDIFVSMGYSVEDGPEVESTYYNFEALNIPAGHPARDPSDTFYISSDLVLRTHTSPVQVRTMEQRDPPIRIVCPGRVFRNDDLDATHSPMFHQIEGLVVDEGITFGDLKGTLEHFHHRFFGEGTRTRLRPSFFPFTEPSAEVDISCPFCQSGCRVCKQTGWLEMMGAGMVNPVLFSFVNYDRERYSGFAFGMGIDRYAMLRYGIKDLQLFFQNDLRFLTQF